MMVLKRLLATALGALTLGALAAESAFAQGQIPAPGLYNNVVNCRTGDAKAVLPDALTTPVGMAATSALEDALAGTGGVTPGETGGFMDIISSGLTVRVSPCGTSEKPDPIGDGFSQAETLFNTAFNTRPLIEGTEPTQAHLDAVAARDAFAGTVYEAVYAELSARASVETAVEAWNKLLLDHTDPTQDGEYRIAVDGYRSIEVDNRVVVTVTGGTAAADQQAAYGPTAVQGYREILGDGGDEASFYSGSGSGGFGDAFVFVDSTPQNGVDDRTALSTLDGEFMDMFDDSGNLRLAPLGMGTGVDATAAPDASVSDRLTDIGEISDELGAWNSLISRQQKQIADLEKNNQSATDDKDRLVKMTAVRNHVESELNRLLGVARNHRRAPTPSATGTDLTDALMSNAATAISSFNEASNKLTSASQAVESAVTSFESARSNVYTELTTTESYLQQLVALRQYEKGEADKKLVAAGDNPAKSVTDAAVAAQEALEMAQGQLASHNALTGDASADNPATALLNALLEPETVTQGGKTEDNPADDDGQALINAISDTYEVAQGAADDAQAIVDELTGEGGQVSMNTAAISENSDDITNLDGRVAANEDEIGMDENGMSRIDHNEARSMENRGMIMDNTEDIATNAGNIMTNAGEIVRVEGRVDTNWDAIAMNQTAIADNTASIGMNSSAIADNANMIGSNSSAISDNRNMIGELSESLDVVRAGVAASMALAGMPAINGRGISIGVGSFDGESAFAVGFQIQGEMASFKVGLTSGGGATGASAGVGFQF